MPDPLDNISSRRGPLETFSIFPTDIDGFYTDEIEKCTHFRVYVVNPVDFRLDRYKVAWALMQHARQMFKDAEVLQQPLLLEDLAYTQVKRTLNEWSSKPVEIMYDRPAIRGLDEELGDLRQTFVRLNERAQTIASDLQQLEIIEEQALLVERILYNVGRLKAAQESLPKINDL